MMSTLGLGSWDLVEFCSTVHIHVYEGYTYNKNSSNSTGEYYVCTRKECMAQAKATDIELQITKAYNHLVDPVVFPGESVYSRLKAESEQICTLPAQNF